jgi:peptidoglycan/LPS O-acetylase OafA/YrhL
MSALARLPGLDGLRGVAVLAVIGYHLNLGNFLPAGFLGVDIFFTVSGFIITALLLQEHAQTGRIDFKAFYLRRARRLFPAALGLLLVLGALTPLLLPAALVRLREDLPAALVYVSNWWQIVAQQSYFEAIDHPRLLQHLWSLAVEEQYYLLWPLAALWLLKRASRTGLGVAAGLIAVASTGWMAWLYATHIDGGDPSRVYLGTDTHLMGLLAGSALAAWWNPWKIRLASTAGDEVLNLLGTAALAALVWAMAETHEGMRGLYQGGFLGVAVLTCAVIGAATREGTWVAWMLSTRPMRWLGARSYSLYLWHWPVVVWLQPAPQADALELTWVTAARLALTLVCAEASYRWVETRWISGFAVPHWRRGSTWAAAVLALVNVGVLGFMPGTTSDSPSAQQDKPGLFTPSAGNMAQDQTPPALFSPAPTATTSQANATPAPRSAASAPASAHSSHGPLNPSHKPSPSPAPRQRITLVGDSVLLGASPYLLRRLPGASVEAKVGRQGSEGLKLVQSLRDQAQLGDTTVIHLGTNGYLSEKQFRALLEQLADRQTVVVVNVYGARRWTRPNNELMARVSPQFQNVRLVDWHAIGQANPDYFVQDGIHLSGIGIHAYYSQIRMALGMPEVMATGPTHRQIKHPPLPKPPPRTGEVPGATGRMAAPVSAGAEDATAASSPSSLMGNAATQPPANTPPLGHIRPGLGSAPAPTVPSHP